MQKQKSFSSTVDYVVHRLVEADAGTRQAIRRLTSRGHMGLPMIPDGSFFDIYRDAGLADGTEQDLKRWVFATSCFAIRPQLHVIKVGLGQAMRQINVGELQVVSMLNSSSLTLEDILQKLALRLASQRQVHNFRDLAALLFFQRGASAEHARLKIAQDYWC